MAHAPVQLGSRLKYFGDAVQVALPDNPLEDPQELCNPLQDTHPDLFIVPQKQLENLQQVTRDLLRGQRGGQAVQAATNMKKLKTEEVMFLKLPLYDTVTGRSISPVTEGPPDVRHYVPNEDLVRVHQHLPPAIGLRQAERVQKEVILTSRAMASEFLADTLFTKSTSLCPLTL